MQIRTILLSISRINDKLTSIFSLFFVGFVGLVCVNINYSYYKLYCIF